jgi:hypothetical protein
MYSIDSMADQRVITPEEERLVNLRNEIYGVFNRFSWDGYLSSCLYDDAKEEEIELAAAIEEVFEKYHDIVSVVQIDSIETFDNPSYTTGAIMVAFVNKITGLETFLEQWEVL